MLENCLAITSKVSPAPGVSENFHDDYCCCSDLFERRQKEGKSYFCLNEVQKYSCLLDISLHLLFEGKVGILTGKRDILDSADSICWFK